MFSRKVGQLLAVALAAATVAGTAQAQNARDGFWFSGGLGYGTLGCNDCSGRTGSISGNLSLGGTISPRFLLGGGLSGWTKSEDGATLSVGLVDAPPVGQPAAVTSDTAGTKRWSVT